MQILAMIVVALLSNSIFLEEGMLSEIINFENMTPLLLIVTLVYFLLGYFTYNLLPLHYFISMVISGIVTCLGMIALICVFNVADFKVILMSKRKKLKKS